MEQGSRGAEERRSEERADDKETQGHTASQRSSGCYAPESPLPRRRVTGVPASPCRRVAGVAAALRRRVAESAASPCRRVAGPATPRVLRLTFRRSQSLDADRKRLAELVAVLSKYEGDDRFEIVVEANSHARYQLDFPNNRTRICRELQGELTQRLGQGGWQIAG